MAEIFGPFDAASPCATTFCSRITLEEYDKQSSLSTERAITDLIKYLEYNPSQFYDTLRKRKKEQQENAGVLSFLKVKILSMVLGDDYIDVSPEEARQKLQEFKEEMIKAYNYAQEAKGSQKRFSRRLADRKAKSEASSTSVKSYPGSATISGANKCIGKRCTSENSVLAPVENKGKVTKDETIFYTPRSEYEVKAVTQPNIRHAPPSQFLLAPTGHHGLPNTSTPAAVSTPPPPPPPPGPPPTLAVKMVEKERIDAEAQTMVEISNPKIIKRRSRSQLKKQGVTKSMNTRRSASKLKDLLSSIQDPAMRSKLKPAFQDHTKYSKETPYGRSKKQKNNENKFPQFNQELIAKFQNARSPQGSPLMSDCSSNDSFSFSP